MVVAIRLGTVPLGIKDADKVETGSDQEGDGRERESGASGGDQTDVSSPSALVI